ncbi:helix-turn-helix transcriptional regulator [Solirubrobacter sp. CPCC 204708]|uniref:Helix-turn-helix domain-containing protein n=1 Tax=Solirubrobacter deserti TaxID=2282478 RepID=A0ABT4RK35_9ACTN|nr:helix-turn-helix domain-containing protein [Solirubrobacter deserti]MBE2316857.1 helix-turn-helix transcriptional regulator [Solirubrobacter deserti]MDA0138926.1 helix-turn-helix domain-containing protein [Solirubrobacter deserti]
MLGDVIKRRCEELNLTQTELADRVGVHVRQIRRYERGEQQPVLGVAAKLAATLGISLDELAELDGGPLDGEWWSARRVRIDGRELIATTPVTLRRRGDVITVEGRGLRGELRVWEAERVLTGWYGGAGAPGTMFFALRGEAVAEGRWVARTADGTVVSGSAVLARTREDATQVIAALTG